MKGDKVDIVKVDMDVIKSAAGLWSGMKESGVAYQKRIRKGWKKRLRNDAY